MNIANQARGPKGVKVELEAIGKVTNPYISAKKNKRGDQKGEDV